MLERERESYAYFQSRQLLEAQIEELITLLDMLDPDQDLEPSLGTGPGYPVDAEQEDEHLEDGGDSEPMLGANGGGEGTSHLYGWRRPTSRAADECEEENEHGGDVVDEPHDEDPDEGTLGAPESGVSQAYWSAGDNGREGELEDSLGWTLTGALGSGDDREAGDDNGLADPSALAEQFPGRGWGSAY
jgi:hypothetical protein